MAQSLINEGGFIVQTALKFPPTLNVPPGHRIVPNDQPFVDPTIQRAVPVEPVTGDVVEYQVEWIGLETHKAAKWSQIKAIRDAKEVSGFSYLGKVIDSDPTSVQRISIATLGASAAMQLGQIVSIDWTTQDNSTLTMTGSEVLGMPAALAAHANDLHITARNLRAQIEAATTHEEIEAIVWPA